MSSAHDPAVDELVTRGIALRAEGKDADALKVFEKAAEMDPGSVRVTVHLATVHQALGNWLLADDHLSLALEHHNDPYVNRHRSALDDAQRVIQANIGRLEVEGQPAGAEVRLNGRVVGTLPLTEPVRATVGSYVLEVRFDGHYSTQRPIVISGGVLVREAVQLERRRANEGVAGTGSGEGAAASGSVGDDAMDRPAPRGWLTWGLAGAGGVAAGTTIGALIFREVHAGRWNDDTRCLEVGRTREDVCGAERDKVRTADNAVLVAGVFTGLFTAGALVNAFAFERPAPTEAGVQGCALGLGTALCFGSF